MSAAADKSQVAISGASRDLADAVVEKGGFADRQDVYRLAIAVALIKQLDPAPEDVGGRINYLGTGSLDPDGSIRTAIMQIRNEGRDRPYALAERLAEAGIAELHEHLNSGRSVREFLGSLNGANSRPTS
jgi:hypothetical protein